MGRVEANLLVIVTGGCLAGSTIPRASAQAKATEEKAAILEDILLILLDHGANQGWE